MTGKVWCRLQAGPPSALLKYTNLSGAQPVSNPSPSGNPSRWKFPRLWRACLPPLHTNVWVGPSTDICRTFTSVLLRLGKVLRLTGARFQPFSWAPHYPSDQRPPGQAFRLSRLWPQVSAQRWSGAMGRQHGAFSLVWAPLPAEVPGSQAGCVFTQRDEFNKCVFLLILP